MIKDGRTRVIATVQRHFISQWQINVLLKRVSLYLGLAGNIYVPRQTIRVRMPIYILIPLL